MASYDGGEWGVLHNLITAQQLEPRGNTNNGRHHVKTYEHGVLSPQNPNGVYRTLTGPAAARGRRWAVTVLWEMCING